MQIVPTSLVRISRYYMLAAVCYLLVTLAIGIFRVLGPLPDPRIHWVPAVLAWVSFPIMGAYYQFFPTLQGHDLRLERFTLPQFALVNLGVIGMIASAWLGLASAFTIALTIYSAGALLFVAVILGNVSLTQLGLTLRFYLASLAYFAVAITLQLLAAWDLGPTWATQPMVLHLFAFGWAVVAIMGAEYSMVPMLQLKDLRHRHLADAQFYLVNAGVIGLTVAMARFDPTLIAAAGSLLVVAIGVFVFIIVESLRKGPARLPKLDISVRFMLVGLVYLVAAALLGTYMGVTGNSGLAPLHVHLGLIGLVTNTIVGAMYHIVPFVVWWEVYAPRLGMEEVPLLKQLFDERRAEWHLYGLNVGLFLMLAGFWLRSSGLLVAGGSVMMLVALDFGWQMWGVVGHRQSLAGRAVGRRTA